MQGGSAPLLKPGDKAGRYELLLQVAQGGMGAVWVARLKLDNGFEKLFAVKTLLTHLADQTVFRDMFLDEARMAAGIQHPNVAQILDLGEQEELLYLVMEWVEGESLNALARGASNSGEKMPYGILLRILSDASAGLHAVHEHTDRDGRCLDIVHRDVSPHNMLVSARGVTKIIDFGVAKARDRLTGATQSGNVKGKLRYMAPEQACGRPIDRRADIWGVGAVLYALTTGRFPYAGENEVDVLRAMISGRGPDPISPSVPAPIERVIRRALHVEPQLRYPTAAALAEALDEAARDLGQLETQQAVATYVETIAGARVAKVRAAIRSAIENREEVYSSIRRKPESESEVELTQVDVVPSGQTNSGTLGSSAIDRRSLQPPAPGGSRTRAIAAAVGAALLVLGGASLVLLRSSSEKSIPSASASPPPTPAPSPSLPSQPEPAAARIEPPPEPVKIDLDEAPAVVPARTIVKATPPPPPPPPSRPARREVIATPPSPPPPPPPPLPPASATPSKKKPVDKTVESAIDTRR